MDVIDLYDRGSAWTGAKIPTAAKQLDAETPCTEWKVRDVLNHLVAGTKMWEEAARGNGPSGPPTGMPDAVISDDPAADFEAGRQRALDVWRTDGDLEKGGMLLGIAFVDTIVHGWDLAKATDQDATIPEDLAEAAFGAVNGMMDDDAQRGHSFKPRVPVPDDASAADKLIGYMGRQP